MAKSSPKTLTLHTVPSTWTRIGERPTERPYQRIVGVKEEAGSWWVPFKAQGDLKADYESGLIDTRSIEVTEQFAEGVVTFLKERLGSRWPVEVFNCHEFAALSIGDLSVKEEIAAGLMTIVREGEPVEGGLELGQWGVIGVRSSTSMRRAMHSVVGLGPDLDVCLHPAAQMGYLGISTYADTIDHYAAALPMREDAPPEEVALFALG